MRATLVSSALCAVVAASLTLAAPIGERAAVPDTYNIKVKNLYPEDTTFDRTRGLFYQSNLWKGQISVWNPKDSSHFNVVIPGVTSSGYGAQQAAGISLNTRTGASRLYAVAKDSHAFTPPPGQTNDGPSSFHAFDLPLSANSKPVFSTYLDDVQKQFQAQYGIRPFGPVDSAQDAAGNSYVVFALGMPAIAKISPTGEATAWYAEKRSQACTAPPCGYTGVAFVPSSNKIVAYSGPRPLTAFDLNNPVATGEAVSINGNFGTTANTEKLNLVPVSGGGPRLVGTKHDGGKGTVYSFSSSDNWKSAKIVGTYSRPEFSNGGASITVVTEANFNGQQQIYGGVDYFGEGPRGGKTEFPLFRIPNSVLG